MCGETVKRERNGKVVGETGTTAGRMGAIVGGMRKNRNVGSDEGVGEKGRRNHETVEPGGLVGGRGVVGEMEPREH